MLKDQRGEKILFKLPSFEIEFSDYIDRYEFLGIHHNGKFRFTRYRNFKDGREPKKRIMTQTIYKVPKGLVLYIKTQPFNITEIFSNFLKVFEPRLKKFKVLICPECGNPLKFIWRDNINAVFKYISHDDKKGIGEHHLEREFNSKDEGNFEQVYCDKCEFVGKKELITTKKTINEYVEIGNYSLKGYKYFFKKEKNKKKSVRIAELVEDK